MRNDQFWGLIDLLGGDAHQESVTVLAEKLAQLPRRTVEAFGSGLQARVDALMRSDAIPVDYARSDLGESLAAAVVGAGETAYDNALGAREPLNEDDWDIEGGEDLLGLSFQVLEPEKVELDIEVRWLTLTFPDDVEVPTDPVVEAIAVEFGESVELDASDWGIPVADDPAIDNARADVVQAPTWHRWFDDQPETPGSVVVEVRDEPSTGLVAERRPLGRHYRYVVPAQRLLDTRDRRGEMRRVFVEAWRAIADELGWQPPPSDPGAR